MKTSKKLALLTLAIFTIVSCRKPKHKSENEKSGNSVDSSLTGDQYGDRTLNADIEYSLTGPFVIKDGASLTIPAGTTIKATGGTSAYIAVAQGGKIYIKGTKDKPVIMTSGSKTPSSSDWGGLVICGKAPTNKGGSNGETATAEVSDLTYGGSVSDDNSGSIKYLRIEYSGAAFSPDKEFNGLSLFGVGSKTTIEYVQSYKGSDDGVEFFGGTVSARYLVSTDSEDDGIDFADGWSGTGEYWFVKNARKAGIEGSNNGNDGNATPVTNATLHHLSIVMTDNIDGNEGAIYIKEGGGSWNASDVYVDGYGVLGVKIKEKDEASITRINGGGINLNPLYFNPAPSTKFNNYTDGNNGQKITREFITEKDNDGAGNRGSTPEWAKGWTK